MIEPINIPSGAILVLKTPDREVWTAVELSEITEGIKKRLGVDVMIITGFEIVGVWERDRD